MNGLLIKRFGGLAVDLQKPGTVMVAALNEWWPDANIFRSLDFFLSISPTLESMAEPEDSIIPTSVGKRKVGVVVVGSSS